MKFPMRKFRRMVKLAAYYAYLIGILWLVLMFNVLALAPHMPLILLLLAHLTYANITALIYCLCGIVLVEILLAGK